MKNNLCFTIASVLTFIVLANVISATITVGTIPELSMTGNSFRFDVSSNGIENITISADPIIQGSQQITFIPTTIEITTAGETKQAIINYTINNFDFQFGKKYSTTMTLTGGVSGVVTKTISFAVNEDYCEELDEADGDLSVTIEEINNNGLGEENEWLPLDEIEVEVNVEAGDYDVKNIELEWGLYNTATQKWVIDGSENDFTLKEGKDKTIVISFTLDENIDELETGSFKFYVRASGKIDADSGDVIDGKKTNRERPYELMWQGADLRQRMVVTYQYDGKESITETDLTTGDSNVVTGKYGKPETLLYYVGRALGNVIKSETFK